MTATETHLMQQGTQQARNTPFYLSLEGVFLRDRAMATEINQPTKINFLVL